jgi:hypothetical protein
MASFSKTLVVKDEFSGRVGSGGKRRNARGVFARKWRLWRADSYPHISLFPSFVTSAFVGATWF